MELRHPYRWSAIAFAACIAAGSIFRDSLEPVVQTHGSFHVVVHVLTFACFTAVVIKSVRSLGLRCLLCLGVVLLGFGTEFYEHLRDGFPVEQMDVVADGAGAAIAMVVVSAVELAARTSRRAQMN